MLSLLLLAKVTLCSVPCAYTKGSQLSNILLFKYLFCLVVVGAFYTPQRLEQALEAYRTTEDNFDYDSFSKQFRGVRCHLRDDETLSVVIQGVTEKPIRDIR